jgi:hypothetical protein
MNWTELKVTDESGVRLLPLGALVAAGYDRLTDIALDAHGAIDQWQQHMLAVGDETPGWEVPTGVDWTGFRAALLTAGVQQ